MSRVIDAIFRLTDEFSGPLEAIQKGMTDLGREGNNVRRQIAIVGQGITNTGKTMTAGITAPLIGLATTSYSTFETVDKNLSLVEATMGSTKYAAADLSRALGDAAVNSIFSMEQGSEALVNFARQGWDAAQSADMLAPSMALAAGTATDLGEVTSGLGNTLKAFGADSSEAAHYADMFAVAQAQANTDVQGLFDAMSVAGPVAQTVGWQFEDLGALIGVFGDANITASVGATALKTGLMRLASPAKAGSEALYELGLVTDDVNKIFNEDGSLKDMPELIGNLQEAFAGLDDKQQLAAASSIFGKNQAANWLALINGPGQETLETMRTRIADASGEAQAASDAMVTPTERLLSTINVFKSTLGGLLSDTFVPLIQRATELIDRFRQLDAGQQQQILKWAGIAAAAGPALIAFGKLVAIVPSIMKFGSMVKKAGGLAKLALAGISSPAGAVVAALAAVVAIGILVWKNWDTIKQKLSPTFEAIQTAVADLSPHFESFKTALSELAEAAQPIVDVIGDGLGVAFDILSAAVNATLISRIGSISTKLKAALDIATNLINFITKTFKGDWEGAWQSIASAFQTAFGPVITTIQSAITGLKDLKAAATEKWDAIVNSKANPANWEIFGGGGNGPAVGANASGTSYWRGGLTSINESGGEIVDLPQGTRIIPHDATRNIVNNMGGRSVTIPKLADQIIVREDADIDRIVDGICRKLIRAGDNMGTVSMA